MLPLQPHAGDGGLPAASPPSRRLLFVNQHYYPDFASTGQHLTDLAEFLAQHEHESEVWCARSRYLAGTLDAPKTETHNRVAIRRFRTTGFGRTRSLGRMVDYATFFAQVLARMLTTGRSTFPVVLTTPPLLCTAAGIARKLRGRRYGIWSMDLHPDAEEALGMIKPGGLLARTLHAFNNFGYRNADFVVSLGPCMTELIAAKGVERSRIVEVPVWTQADEVFPVAPEDNDLRRELGLADKFVVMYSGNAGLAHRFDEVLQAMLQLRDHPQIAFLFVGGGPRRPEIEAFIEEHGLANAQYLDYFPREQLAYSLSTANVHLLTLRDDMAGIAAPGKLYGIMAAGRPTLMVGPKVSEPGLLIEREAVGTVVDTTDAATRTPAAATAAIVAALEAMAADVTATQRVGQHARAVFEASYAAARALDEWKAVVDAFVEERALEVVPAGAAQEAVPS
ncbi:MAG: glycosyltransferase family 4 protein [Bacteroidota bacterium]